MQDFIKHLKEQGINLEYGASEFPVSYSFNHTIPANSSEYIVRHNLTEEDIEVMKTITRDQWHNCDHK